MLLQELYLTIFVIIQDSYFLKNFRRYVNNSPIIAGKAMLKIHNKELAEKTIALREILILFIDNHFSNIIILTDPLTAISVMVMKGIIIITKYVMDIGIIACGYDKGTLNAHIKITY